MKDSIKTTQVNNKYEALPWKQSVLQMEEGQGEEFYKYLYKTTKRVTRKYYWLLIKILPDDFYEDFTHDIFIKLYTNCLLKLWLDENQPDDVLNSKIESYIFNTLKNHIRDILKSKQYSTVSSLEDLITEGLQWATNEPDPEEHLLYKTLLDYLLTRLNETQKFILFNYRKFGGELSRTDLAEDLGISVAAIQKNADKIRSMGHDIALDYKRKMYRVKRGFLFESN